MLVKSLMIGALLALASVTTVHADSYWYYHGPSAGLSVGIGGVDLRIGHGYTEKKFARHRFKGQRFGRGFNRSYSNGYRGKRYRSNRISRGKHSSGRRILGGARFGGHRRYR